MYLSMFLLGAVFASRPSLWPRLQTGRWPALVLALSCWALSLRFSYLLSLGQPLSSGKLPILEGPILVALTFLLSYLGYLAVRRITLLRPWFGLRPLPNRTHGHP
jgi:hypothetical protein